MDYLDFRMNIEDLIVSVLILDLMPLVLCLTFTKYQIKQVSKESWIPITSVSGKRHQFECASTCSAQVECSAFYFDKSSMTCNFGKKDGLIVVNNQLQSPSLLININPDYFFDGYVAFIAGGDINKVELYSPNGKCQYNLAPMPATVYDPVLCLVGDKIVSCKGTSTANCYLYDITSNSWSLYSTSQNPNPRARGVVYNKKIYITDDTTPVVFDLATISWSTWSPAPKTSQYSCLIALDGYFLRFGGDSGYRDIYKYNVSSDSWNFIGSNAPMDIYFTGCTLLPDGNVLLVGSMTAANWNSYVVYNVSGNSWGPTIIGQNKRFSAVVVNLGSRVLTVYGGQVNVVEEFHWSNKTIEAKGSALLNSREFPPGAIAVPAKLFAHMPLGCLGVQ